MTAIIRDPDGHAINDPYLHAPESEDCSMCGMHRANAVWHLWNHGPDLLVCGECALNSLPKLIADAMSGAAGGALATGVFEHNERVMLLSFWRGAAAAIAGAIQWRTRTAVAGRARTNLAPAGDDES